MPLNDGNAAPVAEYYRLLPRSVRMRFFYVLICSIVLGACSRIGSTPSVPPVASAPFNSLAAGFDPPRATGPPLSDAKRAAAINAVAKEFEKLPHKNLEHDFKTLAAFTKKVRGFAWAGVSPGAAGISAVFSDGRLFVLQANVQTVSSPAPAAITPSSETPTEGDVTTAGRASGFPPRGRVAILLNNSHEAGKPPEFTPGLGNALFAAFVHSGYKPVSALPSSVDAIRSLHQISVLYIETHGGVGTLPNGQSYYGLGTTDTAPDPKIEKAYTTALKTGALGYQVAYTFLGARVPVLVHSLPSYFFTYKFFKSDLFTAGTPNVAIINACQSSMAAPAVQAFVNRLQTLGAEYYVGWTKDALIVDLEQSLAFLIDRALGEQRQEDLIKGGYIFAPPGNLPQPAFPVATVYSAMGTIHRSGFFSRETLQQSGGIRGLLTSASNLLLPPLGEPYAYLTITTRPQANVPPLLLAPQIFTINVIEPYEFGSFASSKKSELDILGAFGMRSGTVTITPPGAAAHTLAGAKWSAGEIVVPIQSSGQNASGLVTVISPSGIASNEVPITMWKGSVNITDAISVNAILPVGGGPAVNVSGSPAPFTSSATFNVQFRADVHRWRPHIEATPLPPTLWFSGVMTSSRGSVTQIQGTFKGSRTINKTTTDYTLTYAPPPTLPITLYPASNPVDGPTSQVFHFGNFGAQSQLQKCSQSMNDGSGLPLCIGISATVNDAATCTDSPKSSLCDTGYDAPFSFSYNTNGYVEFVRPIMMSMDTANYHVSVPKVKYSDSRNSTDWPPNFSGSGTTTITFKFNAPVSPPSETTPAIR